MGLQVFSTPGLVSAEDGTHGMLGKRVPDEPHRHGYSNLKVNGGSCDGDFSPTLTVTSGHIFFLFVCAQSSLGVLLRAAWHQLH